MEPVPAWGPRNAWISMILAGVGIMIAVPIVAAYLLPGEEWIGLVGLILVLGGGWCWWETATGVVVGRQPSLPSRRLFS